MNLEMVVGEDVLYKTFVRQIHVQITAGKVLFASIHFAELTPFPTL